MGKVYCLPRFALDRADSTQNVVSAADRLTEERRSLAAYQQHLPERMVFTASRLAPTRAIQELNEIKGKYPNDAKLQEEIDRQIQSATAAAGRAAATTTTQQK